MTDKTKKLVCGMAEISEEYNCDTCNIRLRGQCDSIQKNGCNELEKDDVFNLYRKILK